MKRIAKSVSATILKFHNIISGFFLGVLKVWLRLFFKVFFILKYIKIIFF